MLKKITNYFTGILLKNNLNKLNYPFGYKIYNTGFNNGYQIYRVVFYIKSYTYEISSDIVEEIIKYVEDTCRCQYGY